MSTQIDFEEQVVVPQGSVPEVFDYVSDFSRAAEWRVEVNESTMSPPGPMRLGTKLREVARVAGRPVLTASVVDSFAPPDSWTFAHTRGPLPVSGGFAVEPADGGVRLTYRLQVRLSGAWALGAPYLRWSGRRMIRKSLARLAERLATPR
jgi:Polyketide cyclase / dehydrase and lipid transport